MHVHVTRRGGLAGIAMRGEVDTSELSVSQARLAEDALCALPVAAAGTPHHPDGFQYELAFSAPDGAARSLLVDESDLPEPLRPLIQTAIGRATLG